ncbi:hypothetical protein CR513_08761, partial [Mucuna pruriens]
MINKKKKPPQYIVGTPSVGSSITIFKHTNQNIYHAWKWNNLKDKNNMNGVTCDFCLKMSNRGIARIKKHQLRIRGDVGACRKILEDIRLELKTAFDQKKGVQEDEDGEDEVQEIVSLVVVKEKNANVKGPFDLHFKKPKETIQLEKIKRQTSIMSGIPFNDSLNDHEEEQIKYGYSIMLDGWTDRKNRTLTNFLVNYLFGTMFMKSVDTSKYMKAKDKFTDLEFLGYTKRHQASRLHLQPLIGFEHHEEVHKQVQISDDRVTRFATTFLSLQILHKQKANFRRMFTLDKWVESKINDVVYTLKGMEPIVHVLRLVDNEKRPNELHL